MSFYVTLPSNGADLKSEYGIATNTQTNYFVNLKQTLDLSITEYEVALVELIYPLTWTIELGEMTVFELSTSVKLLNFNLKCRDSERFTNIVSMINFELQKKFESLKDGKITRTILFVFDQKNNVIIISVNKDFKLEIKGYLAQILSTTISSVRASNDAEGIKDEISKAFNDPKVIQELIDSKDNINTGTNADESFISLTGSDNIFQHFFLSSEKIHKIKELFIYTDIIEDQYVGDVMTKLFKIFPVRDNDNNNTGYESVFMPNYLNVSQKFINRINIKIADSNGNKINFADSSTSVIPKLHFRPRRF